MDDGYKFSSTSLTTTTSKMSPKSPPPGLLNFHGKRKQLLKLQILETEILFLQEELKSLEGLLPASRCCKEVDDFVGSISDPFTPRKQTISQSHHFRKRISFPWVSCSSSCMIQKKITKGCFACCSSSKSKCSGYNCLKTTTPSAQNCCKVLKLFPTYCAYCLKCFSCKSHVDTCSDCVENCCQRCCQ
ncbi:PREDICTED: guanine nucleotide-binding protein subunit gamma 3-like [Lupinus angustifolius]|uniref:guanine nucleotide-binding protein subunit gamma 3-like n=1 Tax=Lupinus angustifolius TaxID=3871 RepID=UPI00092EF0FB|nr:PREDICTED: guanine nucleotide-binding protein subunit gamma 3-like [Lupinus angustifolius]